MFDIIALIQYYEGNIYNRIFMGRIVNFKLWQYG